MEGGIIILYKKLQKEHQQLESQVHSIDSKLAKLPEGKLVYSHNKNRYKWYQSLNHQKIYIPKKERHIAQQLAVKKYLSSVRSDLLRAKKALELYLDYQNFNTEKASDLLADGSPYKELLAPYFTPVSDELAAWASAPFEQNSNHPEHLIHKTLSGHLVRSKSEAMIDLFLFNNQIPFRYECTLKLGETTIFPDFTIRHPVTGKVYFWEHLGMMDDPTYYKNAYSKLQLYNAHGIVPTINLIITCETKESPLSFSMVEQIIDYYFL